MSADIFSGKGDEDVRADARNKGVDIPKFSVNDVQDMEKQMAVDELVSITFLLYDSVHMALQRLNALIKSDKVAQLKNIDLISSWVYSVKESVHWQAKILESLHLIGNYKLFHDLTKLYKHSAKSMFETNSYLDKFRRLLFLVCDGLEDEKGRALMQLFAHEIKESGHVEIKLSQEMEINMLQLLHDGIISSKDSSRLVKHLTTLCEPYLASLFTCFHVQNVPPTTLQITSPYDYLGQPELSLTSPPAIDVEGTVNRSSSLTPDSQCGFVRHLNIQFSEQFYPNTKLGKCVIINQRNFDRNSSSDNCIQRYEDRCGTDADRDTLKETFKALNCDITVKENLTDKEMRQLVKETRDEVNKKHYDFLVLCILTHGRTGEVMGCNNLPLKVNEIVYSFDGKSCQALAQKPKMFFIQACRGEVKQDEVKPMEEFQADSATVTQSSPLIGDYLISNATIEGYASFRHVREGSWFIQCLCQELQTNGHKSDLISILTRVNGKVVKAKAKLKDGTKKQILEKTDTFTKKVLFIRKPEGFVNAVGDMFERLYLNHLIEEYYTTRQFI